MVARLTFDALCALALGVTALLGAYLPVYLSKRDKLQGGSGRSLAYVLGNMFSAGVMVSAGFCHLLGEALKMQPVPLRGFPTAPFLCGLGYMLTLIADKVAAAASGHHGHCHDGIVHPAGGGEARLKDSIDFEALLPSGTRARAGSSSRQLDGAEDDSPSLLANGHRPQNQHQQRHHPTQPMYALPQEQHLGGSASAFPELEGGGGGGGLAGGGGSAFELTTDGGPLSSPVVAAAGVVGRSVSFITAMLMGVALCFHSLLEGAAMGAQQTVANSVHIFIAIVSHKGLAAYALGSSVVDADVSMRRFWSVVLPFTLASPVGIFLGYLISGLDKGAGAAAISALASGTFLYVAFMEVIPKELRDPSHLILKMALLLLGFALMSMLAIWA